MNVRPERTEEYTSALLEHYSDLVYRIALSKRQEHTQEVYRTVFLRLMETPAPFEDEAGEKDWLIRTTVQQSRRPSFSALLRHREKPDEDSIFRAPEQTELPLELLAYNTTDRIIIYLYYIEEYCPADIARFLNQKESEINSRLSRLQRDFPMNEVQEGGENKVLDAFRAVHAPKNLVTETAAEMRFGGRGKQAVIKYVAGAVAVALVIAGLIILPKLENGGAWLTQGTQSAQPVQSAETEKGVTFSLYLDEGESSLETQIPADGTAVSVPKNGLYSISGSGGTGDGKQMRWEEQFDFNLRCSGRPDIKRVTYTAVNCEFIKKIFFTEAQVKSREAYRYTDGTIWNSDQGDGMTVSYGFTPIGYVYSADFLEQANAINFGLKTSYTEEASNESALGQVDWEKLSVNSQKAYEKMCIQADIELESGTVVRRTIRFSRNGNDVRVWVEQ